MRPHSHRLHFPHGFIVSYQEFLEAFRTNTSNKAAELEHASGMHGHQESFGSDASGLLGLDAKIPGGKYDSEVMNQGSD